jgi:hypothetical protein
MHTLVRLAAAAAPIAMLAMAAGNVCAQGGAGFEVSAGAGISISDGTPANDIEDTALKLRWRLDDQWSLQLGLQRLVFDAERPAALLGLRQDPSIDAIDAKAKATVISFGLRRDHGWAGSNWNWFWSLDLGTASPKVPTVSGPLDGGGTFSVSTRAKREWIVSAGTGLRWQFDKRWSVETALHADHHQANWRLADSVSGRSAKIGAYQAVGLSAAISARF